MTIHSTTPITVTVEALREAAASLGFTLAPLQAQAEMPEGWTKEKRTELEKLWVERDRMDKRIKELENEYFG